jgi:hypothetical protein
VTDDATPRSASVVGRNRGASDAFFTLGLFLVALLLRAAAVSAFAGEPVWDGHYYDFGARRIAGGFGYSDDLDVGGARVWHPWCHYPVGYSAFLSAFYRMLGDGAGSAHVANVLVGAALPVATFLVAREGLTPLRARAAGGLVAIHPGLILYGALVMSEPLSALLVLLAFLAALRGRCATRLPRLHGLRGPVLGALVLGLAAIVRPQALLCAPFLALTADVATRRGRLGAAAVACAAAVVPVLPWTARNCAVMDGCALVSTNAGWNLAIGAFPRATGRFETLRSSDGCREVTGQVQQDRCWLAYGIEHIRRDPTRWVGLVPAKLSFTFDHESFPVEYLREARPAAWPEDRRVTGRAVLTTFHRVLVAAAALAFVGLHVSRRRRDLARPGALVQTGVLGAIGLGSYLAFAADAPVFWPLVVVGCVLPWLPLPGRPPAPAALLLPVALLATTALAHAIFFGEDRYHVVATPALCLLAAAALRKPEPRAAETRAARSPVGERAAGTSSS